MNPALLRTLVRAWLVIAVVDGIYATAMPVVAYGQPIGRVWQGVASVLLGPSAMQGGARTMAIGLLMHLAVALAWTTVFVGLVVLVPALRRAIATTGGVLAVSAIYGPIVWLLMSFAIIPRFTGRAPAINGRWWVTFLAHIPFVALPIVWTVARGLRESGAVAGERAAESTA